MKAPELLSQYDLNRLILSQLKATSDYWVQVVLIPAIHFALYFQDAIVLLA